MTPTNDNEITISSSVAVAGSRYQAAQVIRDTAQKIMDEERSNYAVQLRAEHEKGIAAGVALAALGVPGRPRKTAKRKRKEAEATVTT